MSKSSISIRELIGLYFRIISVIASVWIVIAFMTDSGEGGVLAAGGVMILILVLAISVLGYLAAGSYVSGSSWGRFLLIMISFGLLYISWSLVISLIGDSQVSSAFLTFFVSLIVGCLTLINLGYLLFGKDE
jgi:hypothetical protein